MPSAFIGLSQAIATLLAAAPAIVNQVERDQEAPAPRERESQINVRLMSSRGTPAAVANGPKDWETVFQIECARRCAANEVPTDAVDPLLEAAYTRLVGQGSALAQGVEDVLPDPEITWEIEEGDTPLVSVTFTVRIIHRTEALSLAPRN
jgi:DNA-binding transcriptional regulator YdaS (Cro superfamily)